MVAALGFSSQGLSGQSVEVCEEPFPLLIEIRSSQGHPLEGASVILPSRQERLLTEASGRIRVPDACPGLLEISVAHIAYGTTTLVGEAAPGRALVIELDPRPIALEGLTVEVETVIRQLERRRQTYGTSRACSTWGTSWARCCPRTSRRTWRPVLAIPSMACGSRETFDERDCYPLRSGMTSVTRVCIDGNRVDVTHGPFRLGPSRLDQVVQHGDIARLEFYPRARLIKVYTKAYILLAAEKPWLLSDAADSC